MMRDEPLPAHYPLANAAWSEKMSWLDAETPPFERIRSAAPWLTTDQQVTWYLDGLREALAEPELTRRVAGLFGEALAEIVVPQ